MGHQLGCLFIFFQRSLDEMKKTFLLVIILLVTANFVNLWGQSRQPVNTSQKTNKRPPETSKTPPTEDKKVTTNEVAGPLTDDEIINVDTNLVTIPVKVLDRGGRFISGLKKGDFKVWEDDVEQEIEYFSNVEEPFTVALILDMSPSSTFKIHEIQAAANAFIAQLRPNDKVMIVSFDAEIHILSEPTNDRKTLQTAVKNTRIESGTSLYEAVDFVVNKRFKKMNGRKAIVLFTDGVDTTSIQASSTSNLSDVYELDALIYPIEYNTYYDVQKMKNKPVIRQPNPIPSTTPNPLPFPIPIGRTPSGQGTTAEDYQKAHEYLEELANRTSGRVYRADNTANLSLAFSNIANELRQTYSLGYYPNDAKKERKRKLKVRVSQKGYVVRARDSYVAHKIGNNLSSK
jgi:Ca-activated chloride channel homolog